MPNQPSTGVAAVPIDAHAKDIKPSEDTEIEGKLIEDAGPGQVSGYDILLRKHHYAYPTGEC